MILTGVTREDGEKAAHLLEILRVSYRLIDGLERSFTLPAEKSLAVREDVAKWFVEVLLKQIAAQLAPPAPPSRGQPAASSSPAPGTFRVRSMGKLPVAKPGKKKSTTKKKRK